MTVWYLARGSGLAALILFTAATVIGAATARDRSAQRRVVVAYLHRVTALLGLGVLALHLVSILSDSYAHVGWVGAVVPFSSGYRPTWVGLGTLAIYTLLLVAATGLARSRFASTPRGARTWRSLHCLAYVAWAAAVTHGFFAGTDSDTGWVRGIYVGCVTAVLAAFLVRAAAVRSRDSRLARNARRRGMHDGDQLVQVGAR